MKRQATTPRHHPQQQPQQHGSVWNVVGTKPNGAAAVGPPPPSTRGAKVTKGAEDGGGRGEAATAPGQDYDKSKAKQPLVVINTRHEGRKGDGNGGSGRGGLGGLTVRACELERLEYSGGAVVAWAAMVILVAAVAAWATFVAAYGVQASERERGCQTGLILALSEVARCRESDPDYRPRWTGVLGFFPNRTAWEPFQTGLYARAEEYGLELMSKQRMWNLTIGYERAEHRKHHRYVFHLHWVAMVCTREDDADAFQELRSVLDFFQRIEDQGWYIVWTVHSVVDPSCTPEHHQLQMELLQTLAEKADVIHLLCSHTLTLTAPYYVIPPEKVITVPQGSYVGFYSDVNLTQDLARRTLSLHTPFASGNDDLVLLYIGSIKRHRGLAQLVQAFNAAAADLKNTQLWVVGELSKAEKLRYSDAQWQQIQAAIKVNPAIKTKYGHVHDDDLQFYYKAADAVVLPYPKDSVLSSGTLLTSFSFGRPVIAPPLGCMEDWLTEDVSIIFMPEEDPPLASPPEATSAMQLPSTLPDGAAMPSQQRNEDTPTQSSYANHTTASQNRNRVCISLEEALRQANKLRADSFRIAAYQKALSYTYQDMSRLFFEKLKWRL